MNSPLICLCLLLVTRWVSAQTSPVQELKALLEAATPNPPAAEALTYKLFGRQSLAMGKAAARVDGRIAVWAVQHSAPARLVDGEGKVMAEMRRLNASGLQVLALELPNFIDQAYKIEAAGTTLQAGTTRIEHYEVPTEAKPDKAVPEGKIERFDWSASKVFPNTVRDVSVYIPQQYEGAKRVCLMVWQDGTRHSERESGLRAPRIMDTLIARGEMPVTIGVFIDPGRRAEQKAKDKAANRSFEYDSLGTAYVTFVIEEILPEVQRRYGLQWNAAPEDHAIAGGSSGGICAFTAAWERPDQFRKVLSWVGSFVNLRGGHVYPALVRKAERKPLRIYLLDGRNDLDNDFGHWPTANLNMAAALKFAGYDHRFDYGECFHGSRGMAASLPDALRWLWRE